MAQSALRRLIENPLETEAQRMAQAIPTPANKNFVRRYLNPDAFPVIRNPDGSVSTHRMASAETDGRYVAYPTIVQDSSGRLQELGEDEAFRYAMANNEFLQFPTERAAQAYADGGYKQGTSMESAPLTQSALRNLQRERMDARRARIGMEPFVPQEQTNILSQFTSLDTPENMSLGATVADMLMGFAPGVGTAQGIRDFERARRDDDMLGMVLGGVGVLPIAGGIVKTGKAGVKAVEKAADALDMSQAARMQRAAEQGFNVDMPVYHGTAVDFKQFDPDRSFGSQFWSTTDKAAIEAGEVGAAGRGVIKEMYQRIKNPAGWAEYDKYSTDELIAKGYDGLALPDADGQITYVAFDPSQYRDVKAAFDPAKRDSRNLMAGIMGGAFGLSALRNINQQEEK